MRRPPSPPEAAVERLATDLLGCILLASAALAASLGRDDAALRGVVCGIGHAPHCGWCYGAVGFALAGLTAFALARRAGGLPEPAAKPRGRPPVPG